MRQNLDRIFKPESLAVIGDFISADQPGYRLLHNLAQAGYKGPLYTVALQGPATFNNIADLPGKVDLALITTPPDQWAEQLHACGKAGVGSIALVASDQLYSEATINAYLQQAQQICRRNQMRLLGPNSMGIMAPHQRLNASFSNKMPLPGNLALISQSGALLSSILDWSVEQRVGFSYVVGPGSMSDIDFADMIDYFGSDAQTSCILIYMESLKNARHFMSAARAFARHKPIIVLKAGRSEEGVKAAFSHTATLTGNDAAFDAAFRRAGVIRVNTIAQLFNLAQALAMQPRPRGNHLAIVSNGGGPGVLATDHLILNQGQLAKFSDRSVQTLSGILNTDQLIANPVDLPDQLDPSQYAQAVQACLRDEGVDGVLAIFSPHSEAEAVAVAEALVQATRNNNKPLLSAWMGEGEVKSARKILEAGRIPNYRFPESAVDAFVRIHRYVRDLELLYETPAAIPKDFEPEQAKARAVIQNTLADQRNVLLDHEAKALLAAYQIPVNPGVFCQSADEAAEAGQQLGYPVVLKLVSPEIGHKTDVGGVQLHIQDENALRLAYRNILHNLEKHNPALKARGMIVEKMVYRPFEIIIGAKKDPVFGPVIVFGRGGIAVEVFKDTQTGLPPLNMALAQRLIEGTRMYPLLQGYRGTPGSNLAELDFLLCKFAYLVMDFPEIKEIEINPLLADSKGGIVVDATVVLEEKAVDPRAPEYHHLVISPYPGKKYTKTVSLKTGEVVTLRPIRPEDEPALARMLQSVSNDSLYMRFFGYIPKITHAWMIRFTHIDYDREMAIVAEISRGAGRELLGSVRIIEDAWRETAEYSILIADHFHGRGLGNIMTDYILDIARDRKIAKIVASVLSQNKPMIKLFEKRGFRFDKSDMEVYEVELDL